MFELSAAGVGLVENGAGGGDAFAEAVGEKGIAEAGEFGGAGRCGEGMAEGSADFFAEVGAVAVVERIHNLEVLLVLVGGAGGEFVEPGSAIEFGGGAEFFKGGEEVVVTALLSGGDEVAHGEGVNGLVVVGLPGGKFGGGDLVGGAGSGLSGGGESGEGGIVAEAVGGGDGKEVFGIDLAGEMDVEVPAFGHADEEGAEGAGVAAGGAKCGFDAGWDGAEIWAEIWAQIWRGTGRVREGRERRRKGGEAECERIWRGAAW